MSNQTVVKPVEFVVDDPFAAFAPLAHEVTFLVPSTRDGNVEDLELQQFVLDYVSEFMSKAHGGATQAAPAVGCWHSDTLGLVKESVTPVTVYVSELSHEVKSQIVEMGRYILEAMSQEAVLVVVDGKGNLLFA